jgi:hypothetical protein
MYPSVLFIAIIVILAGYIIYLHVLLARKNVYIESTVKHLSEIEKNWSSAEMMRFLSEIKKIHNFNSFFNDRLFEERPLSFVLGSVQESKTFIHYTRNEEDAVNILREGFRYDDSFHKTALPVTNDKLDLLIKHNTRKSFGTYMIVISISAPIFDRYASEIAARGMKGIEPENILSEVPAVRNDNGDLTYILPGKYIKGYVNHISGEIFPNPDFEPTYHPAVFNHNLELLTNKTVNTSI